MKIILTEALKKQMEKKKASHILLESALHRC